MHILGLVLVVFLLSCGSGTAAQMDSSASKSSSAQKNSSAQKDSSAQKNSATRGTQNAQRDPTGPIDSAPQISPAPQMNPVSQTNPLPQTNPDAAQYWRAFRRAVLENDRDKLFTMTRFPFEVRGPQAGDPVDYYDRSCFAAIFRRVVVQPVVLPEGEKSMLQLIDEKSEIDPADYRTPDAIQVHQFEFRRINGEWLFTRAYLRML